MTQASKIIQLTNRERLHFGVNTQALNAICNWTHPSLLVSSTAKKGLGVFSTFAINKNEILIIFGGRVLSRAQIQLLPPDLDMLIQIEDEYFFAPIDLGNLGVAERINHSCEPNAGFSGQMTVVAMRDIKAGEEISIDYATCEARSEVKFKCECTTPNCRGHVTGNDWLIQDIQERLGEYFQPFLKRRMKLLLNDQRACL